MLHLKDKHVLVTGAASGIGRATARRFAERGAKLIVCDVNQASLDEIAGELKAKNALVFAEKTDVSDRAQMQALADKVHQEIPALDVLVNNAGVGLSGGVLNTSLEDWDWVVKINLFGAIHGCHFFVPKMVQRAQGGAVINVASVLGLHGSPATVGYCTTKFGVVGLSESMRGELQPHGIRVTAICPGMIDTGIIAATRFRARNAETARDKAQKLFSSRGHKPELVAKAIVAAAEEGAGVRPVAPEAWAIWMMERFAPALMGPIERQLRKRGLGE